MSLAQSKLLIQLRKEATELTWRETHGDEAINQRIQDLAEVVATLIEALQEDCE